MIRLDIYDIKHDKKFSIEKTYEDTIRTFKKYTHSNNIYCYNYEELKYYCEYELSQLSYWFGRQYRQIK